MNESIKTQNNEQREAAIVESRRKKLPKWNRFITWSKRERRLRLGNVVWMRGSGPGYGAPDNYEAKLSFAFDVEKSFLVGVARTKSVISHEWWLKLYFLPFLSFRLHCQRAYGGHFA